jgi:hypothetical protein
MEENREQGDRSLGGGKEVVEMLNTTNSWTGLK